MRFGSGHQEVSPCLRAPAVGRPVYRNILSWKRVVGVISKDFNAAHANTASVFDIKSDSCMVYRGIRDPVAKSRPDVDRWALECACVDCSIDLITCSAFWETLAMLEQCQQYGKPSLSYLHTLRLGKGLTPMNNGRGAYKFKCLYHVPFTLRIGYHKWAKR